MTQPTTHEAIWPKRRWRWLALAGVPLAAVTVVWLLQDQPSSAPPFADVEFVGLIDDFPGIPGPIVRGPNGLVRKAGEVFEFSDDGVTWDPFTLPTALGAGRVDTLLLLLHATDDVWMVEGDSDGTRTMWLSRDGELWERHEPDPAVGRRMRDVTAAGTGFFAFTRNRNNYFWSVDGKAWTEHPNPAADAGRDVRAFATPRGIVLWQGSAEEPTLQLTTNGTDWVPATLHHPGTDHALMMLAIGVVDQTWIAIGYAQVASRPGAVDVWTATDFEKWSFASDPPLLEGERPWVGVDKAVPFDDLLVVPVTWQEYSGREFVVWWATRDGEEWEKIGGPHEIGDTQSFAPTAPNFAGFVGPDGAKTVFYTGPHR